MVDLPTLVVQALKQLDVAGGRGDGRGRGRGRGGSRGRGRGRAMAGAQARAMAGAQARAVAGAGAEAVTGAGAELSMPAEAELRTRLTNHRQALAWLLEATLVMLATLQGTALDPGMACHTKTTPLTECIGEFGPALPLKTLKHSEKVAGDAVETYALRVSVKRTRTSL